MRPLTDRLGADLAFRPLASLRRGHSLRSVQSVANADAGIGVDNDVRPLVTVVVPVRDAGSLDPLVDALERQSLDLSGIEVLIADDGSTDGSTAAAVGRAAALDVRVLTDGPVNSYAARNRGIASARGTVVAFCDADCEPESAWLKEGIAALVDSDLAAGRIRLSVPRRRSVWHLLDVDTFLDQERAVLGGAAATANLFVRRSVFERMGGFDDSQPNQGDHDFVGRAVAAGFRLEFAERAAVCHPTRGRRAFLRKVWAVNRRYAARCARTGTPPEGLKLRSLVPLVQPLRARRRFGRTILLDRKRLLECGARPRVAEYLLALPIQYLFLPYFSSAAQAVGWLEVRHR